MAWETGGGTSRANYLGGIAQCPNPEECDGTRAYYYMVQIRSADEPSTTFYKVGGMAERENGY